MSYGKLVGNFPIPLRREIIAYDNLPEHGGCILHLRGEPKRIDLDLCAVNHDRVELTEFLCALLERPTAGPIKVVVENGRLTMERPLSNKAVLEAEREEGVSV